MGIPGYQDFMLPLLELASDGQEHSISSAIVSIADRLDIAEADRELLLPSGTQTRLYNRVTWSVTYLSKSMLLEKPSRGKFRITERGLQALREKPERIDNAYLSRYDEFLKFKSKKVVKPDQIDAPLDLDQQQSTPDERLDAAYNELREALADELMSRVRSSSPKSRAPSRTA